MIPCHLRDSTGLLRLISKKADWSLPLCQKVSCVRLPGAAPAHGLPYMACFYSCTESLLPSYVTLVTVFFPAMRTLNILVCNMPA